MDRRTPVMTFFENQAQTRKATGRLVVLFLLGVLAVVLAIDLVAAVVYVWVTPHVAGPRTAGVPVKVGIGPGSTPRIPIELFIWTSAITIIVIGVRSLVGIASLRAGGDAVARMCGGVPVERGTRQPHEQRLLNIVDEMAIASGVAIPHVYVLRGERAINAFAAGYAPNQAAIAVTEGALASLNRDELQGVIGHEFSHVLNGDARLNIQMIGVLTGLLFIGGVGTFMMRMAGESRGDRDGRGRLGFFLVGLAITAIGYAGLFFGRLIKAAVSRQREFLADASAVQFTRNPEGIAGALAVIGGWKPSSLIVNRHAETLSHMFFANGIAVSLESLFATHPPLAERIQRISPGFLTAGYFARRAERETGAVAPASASVLTSAQAAPAPALAPSMPRAPVATVMASVGNPAPAHVDYAAQLLGNVPAPLRAATDSAEGAQAVILAFVLSDDDAVRAEQVAMLERARGVPLARTTEAMSAHERTLAHGARLAVVTLALPSLRRLEAETRTSFIATLQAVINADQRVTLEEFVLLTIVGQQLRADAGRAVPVKHRSILELPEHACLVLSLLAHAGVSDGDDARPAFNKGVAVVGLTGRITLLPMKDIAFARVTESLERLRLLAPFVKREFIHACVETVEADQTIRLAEAELLRAVATALDCPVPPILDAVVPE